MLRLLCLIICSLIPWVSQAQQGAWPNRVVRIIATSPPGGSVDLLARALAEDFGKNFSQSFIVENRPGANGNIGVELVLRAPPDGHMLFVAAPGPFSINLNLYGSMPFNPRTDVAPVAMLAVSPLLLVLHPSVPARNLAELLGWMRAERGKVNYASQAVGSTGHMAMELFKSMAQVEATHIPYKGSASAATADLLAGRVAMSFVNTSTSLTYVQNGQLRVIGVAELQRIAAAPDIPTLDQSGLRGFEATPWFGLGTRAGVPPELMQRLSTASARALSGPDIAARMAKIGIEPRHMAPEPFVRFLSADTDKWAEIIKRSGARAE